MSKATRWAIQWRSANRLDGYKTHLMADETGLPLMFATRALGRAFAKKRYWFFRTRPDLTTEPHGWKMPRAVKVIVTVRMA
ncbi:MAG: hypothetical protein Q8R02_23235 [Hyphomonadaceae bacterium]|nr:hypothetical protein [Hyphomonadaceae bacterium]